MSLKIKIDLKKQKIFNSSKMSDREELAKASGDSLLETSGASSVSTESTTVLPDKPPMETVSSEQKSPELVVPFTAEPTGDSVSDADDPPAIEAVSDADDPPAIEAVSDADDPPAIEAISDDAPAPAVVSDADEMLLMEAESDTDDLPATEAVSDVDDPPGKEDVSDADDLPMMEVMSDVDDPPVVEAVSDADDPPTGSSIIAGGNPSVVTSVSDSSEPSSTEPVSGTCDLPVNKVISSDVKIESDGVNPKCSDLAVNSGHDDINGSLKLVTCNAEKRNSKLDTPHSAQRSSETAGSPSNKTSSQSSSSADSKDSELRTEGNEKKYTEGKEERHSNVKQSSSSKTSAAVSNIKTELSDNEENMQLSPQNKLLEVIFKEPEEDEDNMEAFIPEVECTIEDGEVNSGGVSANQEKGDSENTASGEQITPVKVESASETVTGDDETNINNENRANGAHEDSYLDVTGSYSAESCDVDETMQTFAKEFLYSDTSSLGPELDAGSEDGKRTSLSRFPNIVKTVGAAEYSLLQELYKLLYLRNPWDTKEVLSARILDFCGFHFAQDSEDYFNREVTLRGMPQKTLESIAHLLCLTRPISARSNKQRVNLATRIMKFLMSPTKPKRSKSTSNSSKSRTSTVKPATTPGAESTPESANKSRPANRSRKSTPIRAASRSCKKEAEVKVKLEKKESTSIPVPEVKVELTKMEPSEMCKAAKLKLVGSKRSSPVDDGSDSNSKTSKPSDADEATDTEDNITSVSDEELRKLKEFPEVLSNIEGTPEKILSDIHYLLYLEDASLKDLKSNVMEFRGFPVEDGPGEVDERKQFLEKMSDDIIKNLIDTFYLKSTNNKEENIELIIKFLRAPSKRYMKEAAEAPDKMLSERNTDLMDGLSDSDDSITCEIVPKKVDCIDLISSGEEEEKEEEKEEKVTIKKEEESPGRPAKRCLRDFETITKIVNTHPHEYLIDIYNLLYQRTCEPSTLRREILEFTGFGFEKGSDEYVKRKQYLDRMQYNNVRRIFNTLIHNTRDVRVFSKPTMIGEIFQFLFKLPDTDTSIRPPPPKSNVVVPVIPKEKEKVAVNPNLMNVVNKADPPQTPNNTRLSELKRVFQRVACFPCEYLVDVHKLLFMKDCDMKDIRQNIFAFKGFPFGVDSQEFKQRKMYLEYLTFHSLRKISSVLTTKNVDLRNSTKHELSTHLTKVLTEYTNTYMAEAQEASSQAEEITAQANKAAAAAAKDPNVEKIVVTPVIEGFQASSTNDSSLPKVVDIRSQSKEATPKSKSSSVVTSPIVITSTPATKATASPQRKKARKSPNAEQPITQTFEKIIIPTVDQPAKQRRRKKANPAQRISEADALSRAEQLNAAMQFQDIHLPEVESLVRTYQQNPSLMSTLISRPQAPQPMSHPQPVNLGATDNIRSNYRTIVEQKSQGPNTRSPFGTSQFPLQVLYPQQVRQPVPPPNVTVGLQPRTTVPFQIIRPFSMQPTVQSLYYNSSILNSSSPPLEPIYKDDEPGDFVGALPVECILTEGGSSEPAAKKPKLAQLLTAPQVSLTRNIPQPTQQVMPVKKAFEKHIMESNESIPKPSPSFHLKIRDAMTKAAEDEEDCDKPLASLVGHPNDKVLKQQICEIVENTDLQDITINGVIQKIFNMYPKFNLNYRKEFIKSTLRSLLYRLGEQESSKSSEISSNNPDSSVSASDLGSSKSQLSSPTKVTLTWSSTSGLHKS